MKNLKSLTFNNTIGKCEWNKEDRPVNKIKKQRAKLYHFFIQSVWQRTLYINWINNLDNYETGLRLGYDEGNTAWWFREEADNSIKDYFEKTGLMSFDYILDYLNSKPSKGICVSTPIRFSVFLTKNEFYKKDKVNEKVIEAIIAAINEEIKEEVIIEEYEQWLYEEKCRV